VPPIRAATAVQSDAVSEMDAVYEVARAAAFPPALDAYADVQDIGDPRTETY